MDWYKTLAQWEKAILEEGSYIDGIAILVLGKCLGIPEVRVVHEVPGVDLENYTDRNDPVEATSHATVLWSGGNHFEAMVPIAPEAGRKESSGNDQGSATEFCREVLDRHGKDPAEDGSLADAMISFIRRHPRRTGVKKRVHKPCSFRKWTRERRALTRGRASRFRIRGGGHCDELGGGLEDQHRSTETTEVMEVPEAPGAPVTAVTTVDAETPVGCDVMNVSEVWETSDAPETPVITEATLDLETPVAAGATVASDSADASEAAEAPNASEATVAARATPESVSKPVGQASHVCQHDDETNEYEEEEAEGSGGDGQTRRVGRRGGGW